MCKWYTAGEGSLSKANMKTNWKKMYFTIGVEDPVYTGIPKRGETQRKKQTQTQEAIVPTWESKEMSKEDMRMMYKQMRSKPKNKRPTHASREFFCE